MSISLYQIFLFFLTVKGSLLLTAIGLVIAWYISSLNRAEEERLLALEREAEASRITLNENGKETFADDDAPSEVTTATTSSSDDDGFIRVPKDRRLIAEKSKFTSLKRVVRTVKTEFGSVNVTIIGDPKTASRRFLTFHDIGMNSRSCFGNFVQVAAGDERFSSGGICFYLVDAPGHERDASPHNKTYQYPDIPQLASLLLAVCKSLKTGRIIGLGVGIGSRILLEMATNTEEGPDMFLGLILVGGTKDTAGFFERATGAVVGFLLRKIGYHFRFSIHQNEKKSEGGLCALHETCSSWFVEFLTSQLFSPKAIRRRRGLVEGLCNSTLSLPPQNVAGLIETSYMRGSFSEEQKMRLKLLRMLFIVGTHVHGCRCRWGLYNSANSIWRESNRSQSSILKIPGAGPNVLDEDPLELVHPISLFMEASCDCM
eukprot:g492.t1